MFDRIVVVDWSAQNAPKSGADSIWVCELDTRAGTHSIVNHRTRAAARVALVETVRRPGRALIGFDFPFGYPSGFATAAALEGEPWQAAWHHLTTHLVDDARNRNNRFLVAADLNRRMGALQFWGAPRAAAGPHLTITRPEAPLPRFRLVEMRLRAADLHPFSTWQLLGAGSVGSQALTGIPVVDHLRSHRDTRDRVRVWPFETGLVRNPAADIADAIVLAEVWPSAISFDHIDHAVKDARQVISLAKWFAELDAAGDLAGCFAPDVADHRAMEEGWVLGVR